MRFVPLLILCLTPLLAACNSNNRDNPLTKAAEKVSAPDRDREVSDVVEGTVKSADGTRIAFSRTGEGPALIIVGGALTHRAIAGAEPLVAELAKQFTVYTYDRRGRGESTDVKPYAVDREIEDIKALVQYAGGTAMLYGVSSGAALSMRAAVKLGPGAVTRLALYEPPFGHEAFAEQKQRIQELVKTGAPGDAAEYFLTGIGMPREALDDMKRSGKWEEIAKIDFTLAYDFEVLGDGKIPSVVARSIPVPTLVMNGDKSMAFMQPTADEIAKLVPVAERKTLEGQTHQADAKVVAPILIEFFTRPRNAV